MNVSREPGRTPRCKYVSSESLGTHVIGPLLYKFFFCTTQSNSVVNLVFHGEARLIRVVESMHALQNIRCQIYAMIMILEIS